MCASIFMYGRVRYMTNNERRVSNKRQPPGKSVPEIKINARAFNRRNTVCMLERFESHKLAIWSSGGRIIHFEEIRYE